MKDTVLQCPSAPELQTDMVFILGGFSGFLFVLVCLRFFVSLSFFTFCSFVGFVFGVLWLVFCLVWFCVFFFFFLMKYQ